MALSLSKQHTFTSGTTILSAQVNTDFDDLYNAFTGIEGLTKSFSNLIVDSILRSSGTIQSADGAVGAPGYTFTSDTDTGLYRASGNELSVAAGGALIGKFTSAGIVMNSLKLSGLSAGSANGESLRYEQVNMLWGYRLPHLKFVSTTTVEVEGGTYDGDTSNFTVLFPDGDLRTVTSSTYARFNITRNAALSSSKQSGLRTSLSEATNTWYALYAVKATDDTAIWVLVGDTVVPTPGNYATLNSNFGTNGWRYLGMIRNGSDGGSGTGDILDFTQSAGVTFFKNTVAGGTLTNAATGIRVASSGGATTLTYTYSAGTGNTDIPSHLSHIYWRSWFGNTTNLGYTRDATATRFYGIHSNQNGAGSNVWAPAAEGLQLSNGAGSSIAYEIFISGFTDNALSAGAFPRVV